MQPGPESPTGSRPRRRFRHLRQHLRLVVAVAVALVAYAALPGGMETAMRLLVAFDTGAVVFIAAVWAMMARASPDDMRRRSAVEDEGRHTILAIAGAIAVAILLAIIFELHGIKEQPAAQRGVHVALAGATILLSWIFMNTMFALHYAHDYYGEGERRDDGLAGGLAFPGGAAPGYSDFLYFAFVIGMTFQVADVAIESAGLRRVALAQGVMAFFFNVVVLALTINILAGMI
jgi:uncharacterized membrane protein